MTKNIDPFWEDLNRQSVEEPDIISRDLEIIFGTILVLTFTTTVSITHDDNLEIKHLLWAAIACNFAWSTIDGATSIISGIFDRTKKLKVIKSVRNAQNNEEAVSILLENFQVLALADIRHDQLVNLYEKLKSLPPPPDRVPKLWRDFKGGIIIFCMGFSATFPITIPFLLMKDPLTAKYVSDGIGISILFLCGYSIGKKIGIAPLRSGFIMLLVGITFFLLTLGMGG